MLEMLAKLLKEKLIGNVQVTAASLTIRSEQPFSSLVLNSGLPTQQTIKFIVDNNDQLTAVVDALKAHPQLKTLRVDCDHQSETVADSLAAIVTARGSSLEQLTVRFNNPGNIRGGCIGSVSRLAQALLGAQSLRVLDLRQNGLTDDHIESITKALAKNTTLTTLQLGRNNFTGRGVAAIIALVRQCQSIRTLDLTDMVQGQELDELVELIASRKNLTNVDVGRWGTQQETLNPQLRENANQTSHDAAWLALAKTKNDLLSKKYEKFTSTDATLQQNIIAVLNNLPHPRFLRPTCGRDDVDIALDTLATLTLPNLTKGNLRYALVSALNQLESRYNGTLPYNSCANRLLYALLLCESATEVKKESSEVLSQLHTMPMRSLAQ